MPDRASVSAAKGDELRRSQLEAYHSPLQDLPTSGLLGFAIYNVKDLDSPI